jgi:hypothetical protein
LKRRRFVLSALVRDEVLVIGTLLVFFLYGVVVKEDLARMYLMTVGAALALILSFIYVLTNSPLTRREVRCEIILNCIIIIAMVNFIYKILYVY